MAIQDWSDNIIVVDLADDPQFTDELSAVLERLEGAPKNVVLNFAAVGFVNSSNIARLLRIRKMMNTSGCRLVLCDVNTQVWGVLLVTGLDKIFDYTNDIATALTMLQLDSAQAE
ncbi:MAG: STAS domain-containing protein [Phycisphaerae bacterium]|nr:STAS domain-containing protein [Phycisphaerae bacterium]